MSKTSRSIIAVMAAVLGWGTLTLQAEITPQQVERYRLAAKNGNAGAQYNLGLCYERGNGVTKNLEQAVYWYRKAAAQGHPKAKDLLNKLGE